MVMIEQPLLLVYFIDISLGLAAFYLARKLYRLHRGGLMQSPFTWMVAAGVVFALHSFADTISESLGVHSELAEATGHAVVLVFIVVGLRKLLDVWKQ